VTGPVTPRWSKPVLVGELVTLRPTRGTDADAMWEMVNDPEGNDLTATTADFTRDQIDAWCASRAEQDERLDLAIVENATGEVAGEAVLNEYDAARDAANFRIALRGPAWYGRGLGSEATRLLLDHGLRTMRLSAITLAVLARNPRARRAYEKAGFRVTGHHPEDGEEWVDMAVRASSFAPDYPLLTERLRIRPIDLESDVVAMHGYRSREDVCRYVPFSPGPVEALAERLAEPGRTRATIDAEGQVVNLVVERRDTGEVIGDVVLFWHSAADGHAEVGYVLHPDHAGHGFATEATAAMVDLAFGELRAHRVTARIDARNTDSVRLVERLGMRREAAYVDGEWFKGEWSTLLVYAVLEHEWRSPGG
jgi:RimJ/RimL family protein N-acetyltransferase